MISADLYVCNLAGDTIARLSSGADETQWITRSPDGTDILFASSIHYGEGVTVSWNVE